MQCGDKQHTSKENVLNLCQHRNVFYDDYGGDDDDFQFLECLEHSLESIRSVLTEAVIFVPRRMKLD